MFNIRCSTHCQGIVRALQTAHDQQPPLIEQSMMRAFRIRRFRSVLLLCNNMPIISDQRSDCFVTKFTSSWRWSISYLKITFTSFYSTVFDNL